MRAAVPGLEDRFVLYTVGMDDRKNFQGLFRAWARLPEAVREGWQLVMVCNVDEPTRNHLVHLARESGIETRLLLTGFVPDAVLRLLYQSTDLFVFPSLYEGFGLPVAEALACGARVIGSGTSAVAELLDPRGPVRSGRRRVDRGRDRARAHRRARARATRRAVGPRAPGWDVVADRTAAAYERLLAGQPHVGAAPAARRGGDAAAAGREWRRRLQLPAAVGAAGALRPARVRRRTRHVDPALGPPRVPDGVEVLPGARPGRRSEPARGGYDCVVYCVGNSEFHAGALAQLRRRSGVVLAHEVRLTDLYAFAADEPGALPGRFRAVPGRDVRRICRPRPEPTGGCPPTKPIASACSW